MVFKEVTNDEQSREFQKDIETMDQSSEDWQLYLFLSTQMQVHMGHRNKKYTCRPTPCSSKNSKYLPLE